MTRVLVSARMIVELEMADFVVMGTPMNNLTVPSPLTAWIDHVVRIRRTFHSTPAGKIGLLRDRPVIIASAHGGYCGDTPPRQPDFLTPYLRAIFLTIGSHSVEFLRLEGLARDPAAMTRALDQANAWVKCRLPYHSVATTEVMDPQIQAWFFEASKPPSAAVTIASGFH